MHYFQNMSSDSWGFTSKPPPELRPWTPLLGVFCPSDSLICPPLKNPAGAQEWSTQHCSSIVYLSAYTGLLRALPLKTGRCTVDWWSKLSQRSNYSWWKLAFGRRTSYNCIKRTRRDELSNTPALAFPAAYITSPFKWPSRPFVANEVTFVEDKAGSIRQLIRYCLLHPSSVENIDVKNIDSHI